MHHISVKDYYDKIYKGTTGVCKICGKETRFFGFSRGYATYCSNECIHKDPEWHMVRNKTRFGSTFIPISERLEMEEKNVLCMICGKKWKNLYSLAVHLRKFHNTSSKEYYDKFIRSDGEGVCKNQNCSNKTSYFSLSVGYLKYCCRECARSAPETKLKREETLLQNFGVKCPYKSQAIKEKGQETVKKLYGVKNVSQLETVKQKVKETFLKNYGVDCYFKLPEFIENSRQEMLNGKAAYLCSQNKDPSWPQVQTFYVACSIAPYPILNYPVLVKNKGKGFCVDIAISQLGIAIEYDGKQWHKDEDKDKDLYRQKLIESEGWKFIRYEKVPTPDQLLEDINTVLKHQS